MEKSSAKELYGLIGYPVKHSYSAFMHNAAFTHLGIHAEYQLIEVAPEELDEFFKKTVFEKHIRGFNVTVPHKEAAYAFLTNAADAEIDEAAQRMTSVNTVCLGPDRHFLGFNTDGAGFMRDLKEQGINVKGKRVALLGAGGGAKAVAIALAANGPAKLLIFDIDKGKSKKLLENIQNFYPKIDIATAPSVGDLLAQEADILINATPVGMKESDPLLIRKEWLRPNLFVYDLIYNPPETKLLKTAREAGCRASNGSGMLLYQGTLAFQKWTGKEAPIEVMRKALLERMHV